MGEIEIFLKFDILDGGFLNFRRRNNCKSDKSLKGQVKFP